MDSKKPTIGESANDEQIVDTYLDKDYHVVKGDDGTAVIMRRHVIRNGIVVESSVFVIGRAATGVGRARRCQTRASRAQEGVEFRPSGVGIPSCLRCGTA
jgi:hypothetical protein